LIPSQRLNAWICPTYHPSYLLRQNNPVLDLHFRDHLESALGLEGRPWIKPPDYPSQVEIIVDRNEAAEAIRGFIGEAPMAFDYETDRLKPDHSDARIVCCAVSNGERTVAYPWLEPAVTATSELLKSKTPKYGWNIKFEQRWTMAVLGHRVRNWRYCGMIGSHVLDHRPGITSAKFQSYILLGQPIYNRGVDSYLKADTSNGPNRIGEVDLDTLLLYCGMDALVEHKMAEIQLRRFR